jgi:tRNA (mo5U34)-methyltransferase
VTGFSKEQLEQRIRELGDEQAWNHAIELPHGVWTAEPSQTLPGKNRLKWARLQPCIDRIGVGGRRVLDVGCNEGFFSLQMSRAGASEVVACDIGEPRLRKARFVLDVLGVGNVQVRHVSVFDPGFRELGHFDLALCLGFLHRVPNPYAVLETLASMADLIVLEWKAFPLGSLRQPLLAYDGRVSLADDAHSRAYFRPSVASVVSILADCGVRHHRLVDRGPGHRVLLLASTTPLPADGLPDGRPTRSQLLYDYSRWYAARVRDVLMGHALD